MEQISSETEAIPQAEEKNGPADAPATTPEPAKEIFVPVKFNKEIRNLELGKAAELAQKGLKFDAIAGDYEALKRIASGSGRSVSEFLRALERERHEDRKKELLCACGGNEEMADYVLELEKNPETDSGFDELKREFPDIKEISDLPDSVVENARMKGTLLLDEYLRYRHAAKKEARRTARQGENADAASIGPQTDRRGGINPETEEFLKGLWR